VAAVVAVGVGAGVCAPTPQAH